MPSAMAGKPWKLFLEDYRKFKSDWSSQVGVINHGEKCLSPFIPIRFI
jgi:hypothetical protein